jgi:hypothetical protein
MKSDYEERSICEYDGISDRVEKSVKSSSRATLLSSNKNFPPALGDEVNDALWHNVGRLFFGSVRLSYKRTFTLSLLAKFDKLVLELIWQQRTEGKLNKHYQLWHHRFSNLPFPLCMEFFTLSR